MQKQQRGAESRDKTRILPHLHVHRAAGPEHLLVCWHAFPTQMEDDQLVRACRVAVHAWLHDAVVVLQVAARQMRVQSIVVALHVAIRGWAFGMTHVAIRGWAFGAKHVAIRAWAFGAMH
eukprot:99047-Chlamydomonas_euryale.AAC.1